MNVLIINNHSRLISDIQETLSDFNFKSQAVYYKDLSPQIANKFDFFILSGGNITIPGNPLLKQENKLIAETKKPVFGICCGFEIIALLFGGKLTRLKNKRKGVKEISLIDKIGSKAGKLKVFASHEYSIRNQLKNFKILGNSADGIEIIKHDSRPVMATQFHPEVTENNEGLKILEYFIKKMVLKG